jgi:hypothetical protein
MDQIYGVGHRCFKALERTNHIESKVTMMKVIGQVDLAI